MSEHSARSHMRLALQQNHVVAQSNDHAVRGLAARRAQVIDDKTLFHRPVSTEAV